MCVCVCVCVCVYLYSKHVIYPYAPPFFHQIWLTLGTSKKSFKKETS